MCTESVMLSRHLILCHPLLLLPSVFPSIRVFSSESALHITWPKYWSFSFSISPSKEYSGLISFWIDWFDLFAMQGTLNTTVRKHLFFSAQASLWSNSQSCIWLLEKPKIWLDGPLLAKSWSTQIRKEEIKMSLLKVALFPEQGLRAIGPQRGTSCITTSIDTPLTLYPRGQEMPWGANL